MLGSSPPPNGQCLTTVPATATATTTSTTAAAPPHPALVAPIAPVTTSSSQFSLCWNDYKTSVVSAFASLRDDEAFIDVTIGCDGAQFGAHKMLLSACSPFFSQLLRDNPCQHPIVILRDTQPKDLKAILHFMYHGEVSVDEKNLDSFLKAAASLKIRGLIDDSTPPPPPPAAATTHQLLLRTPDKATVAAPSPSKGPNATTTTLLLQQAASTASTSSGRKRKNPPTVLLPTSPVKVPQLEEVKTELVGAIEGAFQATGGAAQTAAAGHHQVEDAAAQGGNAYNLNLVYGGEQTVTTENFEDETSIGHSAILTTGIDTDPQNSTEQPLALISPLNRAMIQAHQQGRRSGASSSNTADGGGPNVCAECGKGFKSKNALLDHEHVHKGATTCPFCGRICSTKGNLKQHLVKKHKFTS